MATAWLHLPADARTRCRMISETMSRRAKLMQQGVLDSHKLQPDLCACQLQMLQYTPSISYPLDQACPCQQTILKMMLSAGMSWPGGYELLVLGLCSNCKCLQLAEPSMGPAC